MLNFLIPYKTQRKKKHEQVVENTFLNNCVIQLVIGTDLKALYLIVNHNKIFNVLRSYLERVH